MVNFIVILCLAFALVVFLLVLVEKSEEPTPYEQILETRETTESTQSF